MTGRYQEQETPRTRDAKKMRSYFAPCTRRGGQRVYVRVSPIFNLQSPVSRSGIAGFTLLEVLVAVAILGIAIAVILQLFSANLRAISVSGNYVAAAARAEAKMREVLDDDTLAQRSFSEMTNDGYRIDVSVANTLGNRTEQLPVTLLEISLTVRWTQGTRERTLNLRTMKMMEKKI